MEAFYARMVSQLSEFLGAWQREWESSWKDRIDASETSPATGEPGAAS
jgi:hypothetical protein